MTHQEQFIALLNKSLAENTFVKLLLANYKGTTEDLKNCLVKRILIKQEDKLSITYRYKTKDIVKNYSFTEGVSIINGFISQGAFKLATLFTIDFDSVFEYVNQDKTYLKKNKASHKQIPSLDHNTQKK